MRGDLVREGERFGCSIPGLQRVTDLTVGFEPGQFPPSRVAVSFAATPEGSRLMHPDERFSARQH